MVIGMKVSSGQHYFLFYSSNWMCIYIWIFISCFLRSIIDISAHSLVRNTVSVFTTIQVQNTLHVVRMNVIPRSIHICCLTLLSILHCTMGCSICLNHMDRLYSASSHYLYSYFGKHTWTLGTVDIFDFACFGLNYILIITWTVFKR